MYEITSGKRFKFVSSEKLSDFIYWTPGIVKAIVFRDPIDRAISSFEYEQWHENKVSSTSRACLSAMPNGKCNAPMCHII